MLKIETSAYEVAKNFIGMKEVPGQVSNPQIMAMLKLDNDWPDGDEVPWCAAFVGYVAFVLGLCRSGSLKARSYIEIGQRVSNRYAEVGMDIVVMKRGTGPQPGIEDLTANGHVCFFGGWDSNDPNYFKGLGGNQNDTVKISTYRVKDILCINRLYKVV